MKIQRLVLAAAFVAVLGFGLAVARADTVYDAFTEFNTGSTQSSTNTWQYMSATTFGTNGGYTLLPLPGFGENTASHVHAWLFDANWNGPFLAQWTAQPGYPAPDKPAGLYLDLATDGSFNPLPGVLAWRSPDDGYATVNFSLTGGPTSQFYDGETYALFVGTEATPRISGTVTFSDPKSGTVEDIPVSVGDMLYFQFGMNGNMYGDDFRCEYTVTTSDVPEPGTLLLLSSALLGLLAYAWRRR